MAFDPTALKAGIEKCRINITTFEQAIEKERDTIKEYRIMIDAIEEQERNKDKATIN
jgi:hypothetical protein